MTGAKKTKSHKKAKSHKKKTTPPLSPVVERMISRREFDPAARDLLSTDVLFGWMQGLDSDQVELHFTDGSTMTGQIEHSTRKDHRHGQISFVTVGNDMRSLVLATSYSEPSWVGYDRLGWRRDITDITVVS